MTTGPSVLLAFDYGRRRIGVAVGQSVSRTAAPLGVVPVRHDRPDWDAVDHLITTWRPDRLVLGLPLNLDGAEQALSAAARRFGRQLEGRFRLPVDLVDERMTSRAARSRLRETGGGQIDAVAAQVILESWFEHHPAP